MTAAEAGAEAAVHRVDCVVGRVRGGRRGAAAGLQEPELVCCPRPRRPLLARPAGGLLRPGRGGRGEGAHQHGHRLEVVTLRVVTDQGRDQRSTEGTPKRDR